MKRLNAAGLEHLQISIDNVMPDDVAKKSLKVLDKKLRILAANVVPEYQRLGIGLVLLGALVPRALAWGIEEAEFSWVVESNWLSRGSLEKGGAKLVKRYRIYDWVPQGVHVLPNPPVGRRPIKLEGYATPAGM